MPDRKKLSLDRPTKLSHELNVEQWQGIYIDIMFHILFYLHKTGLKIKLSILVPVTTC